MIVRALMISICVISSTETMTYANGYTKDTVLPKVYQQTPPDGIDQQLKREAAAAFAAHQHTQLPDKQDILRKSGAVINHDLPLLMKETGKTQLKGYTVKNIYFQTRPGVFATANLYIPDGKGPFPAVVNSHGHWPGARCSDMVQDMAHELAQQGFVCLNIDAWGSGERTTTHGELEYHGANLGAALLNTGNTLLGMQLTDNIRGVDLLCSLPMVDKKRIAATGASGGGNQTMWLAAMDERISAAAPVVSVGTFESYVMHSNCVCELLPDGLTLTEEAGVVGLISPRYLKICNALRDASPTFQPAEMLRTWEKLQPIYAHHKASYQLFNTTHGYWPEIRTAVISWLQQVYHTTPHKADSAQLLTAEQLAVFPKGKRDTTVMTTETFCRHTGAQLKQQYLSAQKINSTQKRTALAQLLHIPQTADFREVQQAGTLGRWQRLLVKTSVHTTIPVLLQAPEKKENGYALLLDPRGKDSIPAAVIARILASGKGVILADLWGTGEHRSDTAVKVDGSLPPFHTLSRSAMWLGHTVQGLWVQEIQALASLLKKQEHSSYISLYATREASIAALAFAALDTTVSEIQLEECPVSYVFDDRKNIDHYNMAIHIPGILQWGDVSLLAALSSTNVRIAAPVSISGRPLTKAEAINVEKEFHDIAKRTGTNGTITINTENIAYEK
ncbi:S9 family peptidase [Chitinophaga sp. sic0106]|uniref:alpha/beta hydrolase family protein n=1 Tax=Chitinophaga sp. sic0106 TaxID=2854785 RepID=UPI001C493C89|nr:acetylxylan esterase [Chitinophaga sp. sic0106]MBV7530701.1 acetylxylan esterase [Chitinophaga sp. sic0106]